MTTRALIARPVPLPASPFAALLAYMDQLNMGYSSQPPNWAGLSFLISPDPSIGRKRRARRARGRQ